jgi:RHS repeat-associated protein
MKHLKSTTVLEDLLYEYDPNGNRTKFKRNATQPLRDGVTGASYDDANEMLTFTPATSSAKNMTYDNNGNLTSVTNSCGTTNYTWDVRNRLSGITGFKPDCSSLTASFKYDALGRRIEKTINGVTTKYLYDGLDIIQEIQGSAKTNYIRTLNIDEPLARIKADGTIRHYKTDALGSVIALVDDTGAVKTTYTYDPFGNVTVSGEASDNPFQYTGRENDETGLYYYRARYYSPELQRFISEDPILKPGNPEISFSLPFLIIYPPILNAYNYTVNSPVNFTDPEGKCLYVAAVIAGAAVPGLIVGGIAYCLTYCCEGGKCNDPEDPNRGPRLNKCLKICMPFLKFLGLNTPKGAMVKGGSEAGQAIGEACCKE